MEPTSSNAPESGRPKRKRPSGDEFLTQQIADARLALESTLDDLTLDVARAADVRRWVRRYPWAAVGTALVAGFTLGYALTSKRRAPHQPELGPDQLDREAQAASADDVRVGETVQRSRGKERAAAGWQSALLAALFDLVRLIVTQFVNASIRQATRGATPPSSPSSEDRRGARAEKAAQATQDPPSDSPDPDAETAGRI